MKLTKYQDHAAVAEEREFLKGYTIPFVQLDPMKTILCFSHEQNTFDKRKLLDNPHPDYVKESQKKVTDFIRLEKETTIKKFFMEDIDPLLEKYEPGDPKMKPDVLKQIAEIEKEREKIIQAEMEKNGKIMLNQPGKSPVPMTISQIAELLTKQGQQIHMYEKRIAELEGINRSLQKLLTEKKDESNVVYGPEVFGIKNDVTKPKTLQDMNTVYGPSLTKPIAPKSKSEPLFKLDPSMI